MNYIDFFRFLEADKSRFINKIDTTEENKQLAIDFFKKHPNYESEIDWNRKDLSWEDIAEVIFKERLSKNQIKNFVKEGFHYITHYQSEDLTIYQPLTWLGSRYLASKDVAPKVEGKWCISYQKDRSFWDDYTFGTDDEIEDFENEENFDEDTDYSEPNVFLFICTPTTKYALQVPIYNSDDYIIWDAEDKDISEEVFIERISEEVPNLIEIINENEYVSSAIEYHNLILKNHKKDLEESKYLEKLSKEYAVNKFNLDYKKQIKSQGYYTWEGNLNLFNLIEFNLIDENLTKIDDRVSNFKVTGDYDLSDYSVTKQMRAQITEVVWPKQVEGRVSFASCNKLLSLDIPKGITTLKYSACSFCDSLKTVSISDTVKTIGDSAFYNCTTLVDVKLPKKLKSIEDQMFAKCSSLKEITIPQGVKSIGKNVFWGCNSITELHIPSSVESVDFYAFEGMSSLKTIYVDKEKGSIYWYNAGNSDGPKVLWKGEF